MRAYIVKKLIALRKGGGPLPDNPTVRMLLTYHVRNIASRGRYVACVAFLDVFVSGLLYWAVEGSGFVRSEWWAIVTASTVGYGDTYPVTVAGRFVAAFLIVSMVMLLLLVGAHLTAWLMPDVNVFTDEEQRLIIGVMLYLYYSQQEMGRRLRQIELNQQAIMRHLGVPLPELPADEVGRGVRPTPALAALISAYDDSHLSGVL